jgi:hypothetical protein
LIGRSRDTQAHQAVLVEVQILVAIAAEDDIVQHYQESPGPGAVFLSRRRFGDDALQRIFNSNDALTNG